MTLELTCYLTHKHFFLSPNCECQGILLCSTLPPYLPVVNVCPAGRSVAIICWGGNRGTATAGELWARARGRWGSPPIGGDPPETVRCLTNSRCRHMKDLAVSGPALPSCGLGSLCGEAPSVNDISSRSEIITTSSSSRSRTSFIS